MEYKLVAVAGNGVSVEVPETFFSYHANDHLEPVSDSGEVYYQIWHLGHHVGVYLNPKSGVVSAGPCLDLLVFANSSIRHFRECVRSVIERYPFHSEDPEDEELDLAGRDLEMIIRAIDPPAADEGTFWSDFISDVVIGSFVE